MATGEILNISKGINVSWLNEDNDTPFSMNELVGVAGWIGESSVVVYDNYDIWQLDLMGKTRPLNITNGYGRKHRIKFRLLQGEDAQKTESQRVS